MKHHCDCHCQQFSFKTDIDPMLIVQCNCKSCRHITGSTNIGCLYGETEVKFMGETNVYEFAGGSGFTNRACFCAKCHVGVYNKPVPEVMEVLEGMISIPLGCFNKTDGLVPKVKIWSEEKLSFFKKYEFVLETFEGNGMPEGLNALLSSLETR